MPGFMPLLSANAVKGKLGPSKKNFFFGFQLPVPQNDILEIALKVR